MQRRLFYASPLTPSPLRGEGLHENEAKISAGIYLLVKTPQMFGRNILVRESVNDDEKQPAKTSSSC